MVVFLYWKLDISDSRRYFYKNEVYASCIWVGTFENALRANIYKIKAFVIIQRV